MKDMQSLKTRAKEFSIIIPFMEGREKGKASSLIGQPITIIDYGMLKDEKDELYVCYIIKEDKENFYFGGAVLTENIMVLDAEGYGDTIREQGLPALLTTKTSKNNRDYTAVTFFPED